MGRRTPLVSARGLRLFLRAFLLEAPFQSHGKQGAGVAWILSDRKDLRSERPLNTNPVLAGYLLGLLDARGAEASDRAVSSLTAALGAIGDRLVYGLLRPLAVISSLLAAAAGPIPAAVALLLVYNPAELALRWRSMRHGHHGLSEIVRDLEPNRLPRLVGRLARITAMAAGALGGYWLFDLCLAGRLSEASALIVTAGVAWFAIRRVRFGTWQSAWFALLAASIGWVAARLI